MIQKFKLVFATALLLVLAVACSTDFIEVEPEGSVLESNYYQNADEAYAGLVATYDLMRKNAGGFENMIAMFNAGSDDHFAGGGNATDGVGIQSFSNYTLDSFKMPLSFWSDFYQGVFRANKMLEKLPTIPMDDNLKARFTAEAKVLRAYYYFNLVNMFKNIPLITSPLTAGQIYQVTQAAPADVYAQIELDINEAISDLPATLDVATEAGRFSKGSAQALLGKVYLYQGKNALAAAQLAEVNGTPGGTSQYGYKLLDDYNELWIVSNKFNTESILEASHTNQSNAGWGNWGSGSDEGNSLNVMVGPRGYTAITSNAPNLPSGWSFNVVTQELYDFMQNDPRFDATILDLKALKLSGDVDYIAGYQDTGYFLNKFTPRQSDVHTGAGDVVLNYRQNVYVIRLADTYLMEAEALGGTGARAQALLDAVRARVGLTPIPVSLTTIMDERRRELAGEGHRWFDLVRTGLAATKLASRGFVVGKHEILPIPFRELENTLLVQNPNYN